VARSFRQSLSYEAPRGTASGSRLETFTMEIPRIHVIFMLRPDHEVIAEILD
jgi:hypothetical protein